jgi:hypothetical protein
MERMHNLYLQLNPYDHRLLSNYTLEFSLGHRLSNNCHCPRKGFYMYYQHKTKILNVKNEEAQSTGKYVRFYLPSFPYHWEGNLPPVFLLHVK